MAKIGFGIGKWSGRLRAAALVVFALVALIAATSVIHGGTADAARLIGPGVDALEACGVDKGFREGSPSGDMWSVGTEAMTASWPVIPTYMGGAAPETVVPERAPGMVEVWTATMTVGMATDGDTTYMGYLPGISLGTEGSLDDRTFTYEGTDYTVEGIFHQQVTAGFQQVVFSSDKGIPEQMVFQAGDDRFPISESRVLGAKKNIHAWPLDTSPSWAEYQNIVVSLMAPSEPEAPPGPICG